MSKTPTSDDVQLTLSLKGATEAKADSDHLTDEGGNIPSKQATHTAADALKAFAEETGIDPFVIYHVSRLAVPIALASLYKDALTNDKDIHGMLVNCCRNYGTEAGYYMNGILIEGIRQQEHLDVLEEGWSDVVASICPRDEWDPLRTVADGWRAARSSKRKAMDKSLRDAVWQQAIYALQSHPDVNRNGLIFLDSLRGRPSLALSLVQSGTLLEEVLGRQKAAEDYTTHQVRVLNRDAQLVEHEATREFLLIPDEATASDLNNWEKY